MPPVDLMGRSLVLETVPTEDYFVYVVLTLAVGVLFAEASASVPALAASSNRGKGVGN